MKIRELMTSPAYTIRPMDSLEAAAEILWQHDIGILPVVDKDGRVGAAITDRDICMGAMMRGKPLAALRVADTMSRAIVTCKPDEDVQVVGKRMCEHQLHRLPVVDEAGKAIGMLSLNDLANAAVADKQLAALSSQVLAAACKHRTTVPAIAAKVAENGKPREQSSGGSKI